ncbi:MAG TPA: rhomboid family intramembrane serine protease [Thermoanaerobaculia bacterium]|nr:rhomboid family intramembrane serine protease [Thermoanaerobaculia bacterium]
MLRAAWNGAVRSTQHPARSTMIPLRHTLPSTRPPLVNRTLVAVNVIVFFAQLMMGSMTERIINTFGYIPARLVNPEPFHYALWEVIVTLVTSLFLHGGFVHLFGNLIYLWIFGGAVEAAVGHARFLLFYVACGAVGSLTHTVLFPNSTIPSIGASGSIAGVLGAFLVLLPQARIVTLFPLVVYWAMAEIPAALFLPVWLGMQFFNGFLALQAARGTYEVVGIAWWAHVGGFIFGALLAGIFRVMRKEATMRNP